MMRTLVVFFLFFTVIFSGFAYSTPLFSNVQVSNVGNGNTISEPNTTRNVAVSPITGTILVVYHGTDGIRVARSTNRGQSFSPTVQITSSQVEAEIAIASTGLVYVGFTASGNAMLSRSTDDGLTFSAPANVGVMNSLQVHMATDGQYVYLLGDDGIDFLASSDNGLSFSGTTVGSGDAYSDVQVDPLTGDVFVQADNPLVTYYVSTNNGTSFGPANTPLPSPAGDIFYSTTAISSGSAGTFLFVSGGDEGPGTLDDAVRIDLTAGAGTQLVFGINNSSQGRSLAVDECGNVVDGYTDGASVLYAVSTDLGDNFAPPVTVSNNSVRQSVAINPVTSDIVTAYESGGQIFVSTFSDELLTCAAPAVQVPSMTQWGLIIFMVLAGIGSFYYLRRKRIAS